MMILGLTTLCGCQIAAKSGGGDGNDSFGYNLDVNGCSTGDQQFSSKSAYCSGLADENRNHGCAQDARREMYTKDCGQWPSNTITGPGGSSSALAAEVKRLIDKRLTGPAVARGSEYFAAALTLKKDRTYVLEMARGINSAVDASRGTSVESSWEAKGLNIALIGSGDATAGSFNGSDGVTLVAGIPGTNEPLTFVLNAR